MTDSLSAYWRGLANGTRSEPADRLLLLLLAPFSLVYSLVLRLRAFFFRIGLLKSGRLPRPVISIGNITVGGTGKTPVTAFIARWLLQQGYRVAVLSRGYGGSLEGQCAVVSDGATTMMGPRECGDEPFLLASTIPGLMVVIGSDRYAAGLMAMQQLAPDLFLLDDGFQHLRLQRDLDLLLLDYARPAGNGWTMPAGLLREPFSALQRADLIIRTRCPQNAPKAALPAKIASCNASHRIADLLPLLGGAPIPLPCPTRQKILVFAGIAEPSAFFDDLRALGFDLVQTISFPDHTTYSQAEITAIAEALRLSGATVAITTEKDGVKLDKLDHDLGSKILLARLELVIDEPSHLLNSLRNLLQKLS